MHLKLLRHTWLRFLIRTWIEAHRVVVRAKPSSQLQERIEAEEKARVEARVQQLGSDGLSRLAEELAAAKAASNQPIPHTLLESFPIPDVNSISWIPVTSAQNRGIGKVIPAIGGEALADHIAKDAVEVSSFVSFQQIKVCSLPIRATLIF
jgi:Zn-dependent M16 (insulinase) family peptidase